MVVHKILFVSDQKLSRDFYKYVFQLKPRLDVPGMTEFELNENCILGLMPIKGIQKIIGEDLPKLSFNNELSSSELYFKSDNSEDLYGRAKKRGAKVLSPWQMRDWSDRVAYVADSDGHIIAFAT